jgi:hypothetical protein
MKKLTTILLAASVAIATLTACTTTQPEIEQSELNQGWYYGDEDTKKANTPEDWTWLEDEEGGRSKWIEPAVTEMLDYS